MLDYQNTINELKTRKGQIIEEINVILQDDESQAKPIIEKVRELQSIKSNVKKVQSALKVLEDAIK